MPRTPSARRRAVSAGKEGCGYSQQRQCPPPLPAGGIMRHCTHPPTVLFGTFPEPRASPLLGRLPPSAVWPGRGWRTPLLGRPLPQFWTPSCKWGPSFLMFYSTMVWAEARGHGGKAAGCPGDNGQRVSGYFASVVIGTVSTGAGRRRGSIRVSEALVVRSWAQRSHSPPFGARVGCHRNNTRYLASLLAPRVLAPPRGCSAWTTGNPFALHLLVGSPTEGWREGGDRGRGIHSPRSLPSGLGQFPGAVDPAA